MRSCASSLLVAALALAGAGPAAAQVAGLPVFNSGVDRGLTVAGDVGFANDAGPDGTAWGLSAMVGLGRVGVTATVARFDPDARGAKASTSMGGAFHWKAIGGPLVPFAVHLQAGLGYRSLESGTGTGGSELRVPVGLGLAATIPSPVASLKPWVAPRADIRRTTSNGSSDTETRVGVSAGVDLGFIFGLGLRAAYDVIRVSGKDPSTFSLGAAYGFRL
ncbi:MAG: hypothetical protein ACOY71_06010 [Gemmatimonadota bacterium]